MSWLGNPSNSNWSSIYPLLPFIFSETTNQKPNTQTTNHITIIIIMLLYFLISCLSFFFLSKSLSLPPWASQTKTLLSFYFSKNPFFINNNNLQHPTTPDPASPLLHQMSVLDLPDLPLDLILDLLPPSGLSTMAMVCSSLRDRCVSDHLWQKHLMTKWGKILGPAAHRQWKSYLRSSYHLGSPHHQTAHPLGFAKIISFIRSVFLDDNKQRRKRYASSLPLDSTMSCYLSLETGRFWFPAQVYNRENGHVGFMLSCYDAELSYDTHTDTFQARYPPHGRRPVAVEKGVTWERLRATPIDASPHHLHVSDSLNELKPGDHIEIQWRRNKDFPYGWWYGIVGHLESCDGNLNHCHCHLNEMVVLEFNQYTVGSRWRRTMINKRDHREEGNEEDGFYGGIRKLSCKEEIAMWTRLWPSSILE